MMKTYWAKVYQRIVFVIEQNSRVTLIHEDGSVTKDWYEELENLKNCTGFDYKIPYTYENMETMKVIKKINNKKYTAVPCRDFITLVDDVGFVSTITYEFFIRDFTTLDGEELCV